MKQFAISKDGNCPPLRFKAVNTETGEVLDCFSVKFFSDGGWIAVTFNKEPKDWLTIQCPPNTKCDWVLCQSTGLHDARGVEIFCGDVLLDSFLAMFYIFWEDGEIKMHYLDWDEDHPSVQYSVRFDSPDIRIGNRYMHRKALEQKAEEVIGRE